MRTKFSKFDHFSFMFTILTNFISDHQIITKVILNATILTFTLTPHSHWTTGTTYWCTVTISPEIHITAARLQKGAKECLERDS